MAHRITAPAMQRAQRLLTDRIEPAVLTGAVPFVVHATEETFEPVPFADATRMPLSPFAVGTAWGRPWHFPSSGKWGRS